MRLAFQHVAVALGLLTVAACAETVAPFRGASRVRVQLFNDRAAEAVAMKQASHYSAAKHPEVAQFLAQREPVIRSIISCPGGVCDKGGDQPPPSGGNTAGPVGTPSPTNPASNEAVIFSSSTTPFMNGGSGMIISQVTYYGNNSSNIISYAATKNGQTLVSATTDPAVGEGDQYPAIGGFWDRAFTFRHTTTLLLNNVPICGVVLTASGSHYAWWAMPGFSILGQNISFATWGKQPSTDLPQQANNGECEPTQTTKPIGGGRPGEKGGDGYACETCIHWGVFVGSTMVNDYWECDYSLGSCGTFSYLSDPLDLDRTKAFVLPA